MIRIRKNGKRDYRLDVGHVCANQALAEQDKKIIALVSVVPKSSVQPTPKLIQSSPIPQIVLSPNPAKTILVFYKNNEKMANEIVAALRNNGFESAAANSSLDKIKQWVDSSDQNDINICANGENQELLDSLKSTILSAIPSAGGNIYCKWLVIQGI